MAEGNLLSRRPSEELGLEAPLPDFFERLAAQRRRSVQRHEGPTTGIGGEIPFLARHIRDQLLSGPRAMGRVARGELDPTSREGVGEALGIALQTVGARAPFAKAGELGVGGGKLPGAVPAIEDELKALLQSAGVHVPEAKPTPPAIAIKPYQPPSGPTEYDIVHPETGSLISTGFPSEKVAAEYWAKNHSDLMHIEAYKYAGPQAPVSPISATKPPMKAQPMTPQEEGDWQAISKAFGDIAKAKKPSATTPPPAEIRENAPTAEELKARREASPFQTLAYRGLKGPLDKPELTSKGYSETYLASHPGVADLYAGVPPELAARRDLKPQPWQQPREGSNVLPILLDTSNYHTVDAGGHLWASQGSRVMQDAIEHAKKNGHSGVIVKNIHDEPSGDTAYLPPTDVYIPLDNRGRLPWADFDPTKWHMKDLLAGFGGIAVPAGVAGKVLQRPDGVHHFLQDTEDDSGAFTGASK